MRISDWSSDVCSSDLRAPSSRVAASTFSRASSISVSSGKLGGMAFHLGEKGVQMGDGRLVVHALLQVLLQVIGQARIQGDGFEIGRASCRERGSQYV